MLPQDQISLQHPGQEAVHGQVEAGIVVFHGGQELPDLDLRVQLLPDLPDQGLGRSLSRLELPAGELPKILIVPIAPLGGEDPLPVANHGGDNLYRFHGTPPFLRRALRPRRFRPGFPVHGQLPPVGFPSLSL